MTQAGALRSVLVAGSGITAWCAAAALKRLAPFLDVTLLATRAEKAPALADRIACTLPSLPGFHGDLGLRDADAVTRTGSSYRLGTLFSGWAAGSPDYVHAYGRYGRPFGPTSFHLLWVRAARAGAARPFDSYSPAAALARAGRFAVARDAPASPLADHGHGLTLDLARYAHMIKAFAVHCGVRVSDGEIAGIDISECGTIGTVRVVNGRSLTADLFVDATGPAALLRSALDDQRDDWSRWLPCDRVLLAEQTVGSARPVLTTVTALAAGWRWTSGAQSGLAYRSDYLSDREAAHILHDGSAPGPAEPIAIRAGTRPAPWRGNCVAIGDAATEIEPLEWCNLHLALSAIDRLVTMLPGRDVSPVEAAEFNRQTLAEAERVRDFLAAHYQTARRYEPFWRAAAGADPPASLAHTLATFAERGRLPFYEEETFARDSWAAVLLGQGFLPRRVDQLVDAIPAAQAEAAMATLIAEIAAAVVRAPSHADYLAAQARLLGT